VCVCVCVCVCECVKATHLSSMRYFHTGPSEGE
jgi:hypothetical protein